ncbi:hypothetical protein QBC35DRAFT_24972 [Podospora australis]|uniref:Uncharacterized protein n=1 Tax=Podospora australis TaxID=1536484 RepID=A0AAN7AMU3_9PEZI|nr:hypothetical protein QBC35DRAFT_24972 [Podospora australis]
MAAISLVTPIAALLVAVFSTLYAGHLDAILLVFFTVARQSHRYAPVAIILWDWARPFAVVTITSILTLTCLYRVIRSPIWTEKVETSIPKGPDRVLLFPSRVVHSRPRPVEHRFILSYLLVGIPVDFEENAAGMVSVGVGSKPRLLSSVFPSRKGWFDINPTDYLERGKPELGLRARLDGYLQTQGVDPGVYPIAYLVTAPRFLGYAFNPVSFWYLYDTNKNLQAVILEVNNTFGERRMYIINEAIDGSTGVKAASMIDKDFHVSPFNFPTGDYIINASDPFDRQDESMLGLRVAIMTRSEGFHTTVVSLRSSEPAIDPFAMTAWNKGRFVLSWGWVGLLTMPRILKEAAVLHYKHKLPFWYKPEPLKGTVSRKASSTERQLEPIFRNYLRHLVEQSSSAIEVTYLSSGLDGDITEVMLRASAKAAIRDIEKVHAKDSATDSEKLNLRNGVTSIDKLEFRVLTPVFYSRFVYYAHDMEAFFCELNESSTIWVSQPDLLPKIALKTKGKHTLGSTAVDEYAYFKMIQNLRVRPPKIERPLSSKTKRGVEPQTVDIRNFYISSMDAYVIANESAETQKTYRRCVLKLFLSDRLAFGSVTLLEGQRLLVQSIVAWLLSVIMSGMLLPGNRR